MSETNNAVTQVRPSDENLPAHLRQDIASGVATGTEELAKYVRPPMLKIVQKQSDDEVIARFGIGTTIIMPDESIVAPKDELFKFVPLFFYSEAIQWAPISARGKVPPILQRTTDQNSALFRKAKNKATWTETIVHPEAGAIEVRNCEHLNLIVTLYDHPLQGIPMIMTFARGEFGNGISVMSKIKARRAPIFGCVFSAIVDSDSTRKNAQGSWHGWDVRNPDNESERWVADPATYEEMKKVHGELADAYKSNAIVAEYEGATVGEGEVEDRDDM